MHAIYYKDGTKCTASLKVYCMLSTEDSTAILEVQYMLSTEDSTALLEVKCLLSIEDNTTYIIRSAMRAIC